MVQNCEMKTSRSKQLIKIKITFIVVHCYNLLVLVVIVNLLLCLIGKLWCITHRYGAWNKTVCSHSFRFPLRVSWFVLVDGWACCVRDLLLITMPGGWRMLIGKVTASL